MAIQSLITTVIRPEDLLVVQFQLVDVDFEPPAAGQPGRVTGAGSSFLIVHLQAQHLAEEAFFQTADPIQQSPEEAAAGQPPLPPGTETPAAPGLVRSRLAGPSRLVFVVPPGTGFDYTLAGLLGAIPQLPLSVAPVSAWEPPRPGCSPLSPVLWLLRRLQPPPVAPPGPTHTALEIPYRVVLSPDPQARWQHAPLPVTRGLRTEIWHTRLSSRRADGDPRVRAIWSPDFQAAILQDHDNLPFRASLDARDRNELVHLTANFLLDSFEPTPVRTERMMLTTLGAWLRVQGDWDPPSLTEGSLTVEQWRHDAVMGRDQYVRVMYAGYLFPFGHRASLVKVTERKFFFQDHTQPPGMVAYLFQRMFIVVREPARSYSRRDIPFRTVTLRTRVTPNLDDPQNSEVVPGKKQEAFWPRVVSGATIIDFPFHLAATDWDGRTAEFTAPLLFVSKNVDEDAAQAGQVVSRYNGESLTGDRRRRLLAGQGIAFAPSSKPGDTTLETISLTFGGRYEPGQTPHFLPVMSRAQVDVPAVKQLLGGSTGATIEWEPTYLTASGTAIGNAGQVFTRLVTPTPLAFSPDQSGGLVAPNIGISGLSRALGPVGGPVDALIAGRFNPLDIFDANVKLLGGIKLGDIIKNLIFSNAAAVEGKDVLVGPDAAGSGSKLPKLVTERDGNLVRTRYQWALTRNELVDTGLFVPGGGATFKLQAVVETPLDGTPPTFRIEGALNDFSVLLLPKGLELIRIEFESLTFTAVKDKKPDVAVQLRDVKFLGFLAFVNDLSQVIPLDGFNDPPSLRIVPPPNTGLEVGFSMGLPTVGLGLMTMQNISLSAGFYLPFVANKPTNFRFAFCERHQPFILTVSLFGGGGFFAIELGIDKVVLIEAALEFGASIALNLGVAAGQASIMGGFYFQKAGADFQLTGYFRASGELEVLGIITVSVELYLGLTYASKPTETRPILPHAGTMWGQARLTVKIKIVFFSVSVSISMERELAGSDPTFRQLVAPADWTTYCEAFAGYPPVPGD